MESNRLRISSGSPQEELRIINEPDVKPKPKAKEASCKQHSNTKRDHQEEEEEEEEDEEEEKERDDNNNNLSVGFPWTAGSSRAYTCSFCKRKFRSAQALGGHMNVHRRDRAKLRRASPPILLDSIASHHHHYFLGSSSDQQPIKFLKLYDFSCFHGQEESDCGCKIWKKKVNKFVKKKETALLNSSNEIDLELRLGF